MPARVKSSWVCFTLQSLWDRLSEAPFVTQTRGDKPRLSSSLVMGDVFKEVIVSSFSDLFWIWRGKTHTFCNVMLTAVSEGHCK